jgi:hypothetical protein
MLLVHVEIVAGVAVEIVAGTAVGTAVEIAAGIAVVVASRLVKFAVGQNGRLNVCVLALQETAHSSDLMLPCVMLEKPREMVGSKSVGWG